MTLLVGSSFVADPFGQVIAEASQDKEEILVAECDPRRCYEQALQDHLLMHVHGSVRFGMRPTTHLRVNVPFSEPVRYPTQEISARMQTHASSPSADGQLLMASPIIAGGHKKSEAHVELASICLFQRHRT